MTVTAGVEPQVHLITGATAGLGLETASALAERGASVVLAGRGEDRLAAAREAVLRRAPLARVDTVELDLSSLARIRDAAARLRDRYRSIDVLVNNAGVMYTPMQRTEDGFEMQFGVNHLGHFEFTKHLLPVLLADRGARIVNVASAGHRANGIDFDDPNWQHRPYDKFAAYAAAKTANILFTVALEDRLAGRRVHALAVHPGTINTTLGRHMTRDDLRHLKQLVAAASGAPEDQPPPSMVYDSVEDGAATSVWAATAPELDGVGGVYLSDRSIAQAAPHATDRAAAQRLWDISEALCGPWPADSPSESPA